MRHFSAKIFALSLYAMFHAVVPANAEDVQGALVEEELKLLAQFNHADGSGYTVNLDALVIRPNDGQRHPLAVISHGTVMGAIKRTYPRELRSQALEMARRGWVTVIATRRGYGNSEGGFSEGMTCDGPSVTQAGRASAADIRETIHTMADKPYVDASKVIAIGHSSGGFAVIASSANPPPGLVAVINFAGGRHASDSPDKQECSENSMVAAMATYGKTSRLPTLWVYAENDHRETPALVQRMYSAFTGAGGNAEFIASPAFGSEGHYLFSRAGTSRWTTYADAFLNKQGLKLLDTPISFDESAGVDFPSGLDERGRRAYLDYLDGGEHKAFAANSRGAYSVVVRKNSAQDAIDKAMEDCKGRPLCSLASVDDHNQ